MGSIPSLTTSDKNQDFSAQGVTKGVEDDILDNDCVLSEKEFNKDTTDILEEACDNSINEDDSFIINNKVVNMKEETSSKCAMALQDQKQQSVDNVSDISTESFPAKLNLVDKQINNKNMFAEDTKLHYDKYGKSFPKKQGKLPETGFDDTVTNCQIKEESSQYPPKVSGEKKSQIATDALKAQSEITSCSVQTEERADDSHNSSGKNNENNIYKRSVIIETLITILNSNRKQRESNTPVTGAVTANVKSLAVENKKAKGYFNSFSSFLSGAPTESDTEARKLQRSSVMPDKLVFDAIQVRKQLKSGVERVMSQLEKLQKALYTLQVKTDNSFALTISESLKNQIKGMMIAVTQMYHIVYNTPQSNISFLDTLNQMAAQLRKAEEQILKNHDAAQDPETYFLHFQQTLDSL